MSGSDQQREPGTGLQSRIDDADLQLVTALAQRQVKRDSVMLRAAPTSGTRVTTSTSTSTTTPPTQPIQQRAQSRQPA
ncbi:hypothetical protein VB151_00370 [Xanthomonas fragariae]|nr:hypothetical protein [Xanthomonas fragariae]AOD13813.1 hypothetical protein BER92_02605 [Xanthomonas fragariae]AOD17206.1 hypothetical protein BER93_02610 [Xanthomonas fragariae]MBL9197546.1 hypothetical protein [Xanthomonas fragariae]MBL9222698.1 hypothetical protein [Xanthomonas fragariae]MDM7581030.1 hypothetical protein [Xanthomonas fragariae]